MSLMRRNPYSLFNEMDRMIDRMRSMMDASLMSYDDDVIQPIDTHTLAVDVTSDEDGIVVRTALPGFKQEEVNVDVQGNRLTISAESKVERDEEKDNWHIREMRYGKFSRSVMLPEEVNVDVADASLEDGILTVKLPKAQPNPIHKIAVKAKKLLGGGKKSD